MCTIVIKNLSLYLPTSCLINTGGAIVSRRDQLLMAACIMLGFNLLSLYNASNPSITFTTSYQKKSEQDHLLKDYK